MIAPRFEAAEAAQVIEPGFRAVLTGVCDRLGIDEAQLRSGEDEAALQGRAVYFWLCDQLKTSGLVAAACYLGADSRDALACCHLVDRQRGKDRGVRDRLDELALTLHCEAAVLSRLGLTRRDASRPVDIARRVMVSARAAGMASSEDIQSLGAGYLTLFADRDAGEARLAQTMAEQERDAARASIAALEGQMFELQCALVRERAKALAPPPDGASPLWPALRAFAEAGLALDGASGPGERVTRQRHEKAVATLQAEAEQHFKIKRTANLKGASK